jgi:hypothetical protein
MGANRATLVNQWHLRLEFEEAGSHGPLPIPLSRSTGPHLASNWGRSGDHRSQPIRAGLERATTPLNRIGTCSISAMHERRFHGLAS